MKRRILTACLFVAPLIAAQSLSPTEALACGGCFAPPTFPTVVSGHRMVMSVSPEQSVLWDQIQYSGEPEEFAWVLPVKPGARVEASTAAFFEVFEAQTTTRVLQPPLDCGGGSSSGCGLGSFAASDASGGDGEEENAPEVEVVHQGTVGPYETVTLSTDVPGALNEWLESHGYNVDESTQPIIDQYVAEGFDFIALRLQPGKGVQQMTPVRVVMEGMSLTLPLRMVGIGTGAKTPIVLHVIGEGRYTTQNFEAAQVSTELLSWNFKTSESNYPTLRDEALAGNRWLTSYAQPGFFASESFDQFGNPISSFLQLYFEQATSNSERPTGCALPVTAEYELSGKVDNPCPPGEPWDSPACGDVAPGDVDGRKLGCEGLEDVAVALEGLRIGDVWVTRLEGQLDRDGLGTDLQLQASSDQSAVTNILQANIALEAEGACPSGVLPRVVDVTRPNRVVPVVGLGLSALLLALVARRARQQQRKRA